MSDQKAQTALTGVLRKDTSLLDRLLRIGKSFDLTLRDLRIAERGARLYFVEGFAKSDTMLRIMGALLSVSEREIQSCADLRAFAERFVAHIEIEIAEDAGEIAVKVLSGKTALLVDGFVGAVLIDAREYPTRSMQEPENDRVLRGARDSFSETLLFNTALIRRHIRDARLVIEHHSVGTVSQTDLAIVYLEGRADEKRLRFLREKLETLDVKSLTMGQESLAEALIERGRFNPFPKIRYTERPDMAAATINEGRILVLVDATPTALILPTGFFDFFQDTNDYNFPPLVGTYLRSTRYLIYLFTLLLIPTWYLLVKNPQWAISQHEFIAIQEPNELPLLIQLLIIELIIDCLRQASLNTPAALGSSFSTVAALILGEFAVRARWFVPEVLLYMGFVAVSNFAQPSFELGYAFKLCRILLVVLVAIGDIWGYVGGLLFLLLLLAATPTVTGDSYLYPLFPFDFEKLSRLLVRRRFHADNS